MRNQKDLKKMIFIEKKILKGIQDLINLFMIKISKNIDISVKSLKKANHKQNWYGIDFHRIKKSFNFFLFYVNHIQIKF